MEDTTGATRKPKSIRTSGGGVATQAGTTFQNGAAAWVAVRILAEQAASPPWDLPADVTLESISCETDHPTDDILITTSANGCAFVQAKRGLRLRRQRSSRFASAVDQFVREFALARNQEGGKRYDHGLSSERDRLILLVSRSSSAPIREGLRSALDKIRTAGSATPFSAAAMNRDERQALDVFRGHLAASWKRAFGRLPSEDEFAEFASLVRVFTLDADQGGDAEREAKDSLRSVVLHDPKQADVSWSTLVQVCAGLASSRSGADRAALQRVLLDAGVGLRAVRSYWADIEQLRRHSRITMNLLTSRSRISVGATIVKISRPSTEALRAAAENASLVVVSEPGAGKSGALHDVVAGLQDEGRDVVFLAVDRLEAQSLPGLRDDIGLSHEVVDVLANWHGPSAAFLVIDALDAARRTRLAQVLVDLMSEIAQTASRWRIIASIRKFDLRCDQRLRSLFTGPAPSEQFQDGEFSGLRHISIPRLDDDELSQIRLQSPQLADLVARSKGTLRDMLRVLFNLRLVGDLLGEGVPLEELTPIRTQIELLDRYWLHRVIRNDGLGDAREETLRRVANEMVDARQLQVDRRCVACDLSASPILDDMLESHILLEWQPGPAAKAQRRLLAFDHHVLFDYAVARLLLGGDFRAFTERLVDDPELLIAIRPSLVLHFQCVWFADPARDLFWAVVIEVTQAQGMPEIGKVIGPGAAAELASSLPDLDGLRTALETADGRTREAADQVLRHLFGALLSIPVDADRALVGKNIGPWCELLVRLTRTMRASIAYTVRLFLSTVLEHPEALTAMQRKCAGEAARQVLVFAWKQHPRDSWLVIHSLQAVCRTFAADTDASGA